MSLRGSKRGSGKKFQNFSNYFVRLFWLLSTRNAGITSMSPFTSILWWYLKGFYPVCCQDPFASGLIWCKRVCINFQNFQNSFVSLLMPYGYQKYRFNLISFEFGHLRGPNGGLAKFKKKLKKIIFCFKSIFLVIWSEIQWK